jgi:hypothetical protein
MLPSGRSEELAIAFGGMTADNFRTVSGAQGHEPQQSEQSQQEKAGVFVRLFVRVLGTK